MPTLKYQGCSLFRQRIVASLLTCQPLKIENIRSKDDAPGLQDFEASFIRLIEKLTDGCHIEINETGTTLRFKPGLLQGSSAGSSTGTGKVVTHDCGTSRSIGWFIEGIIPIALFCKTPVQLILTGITNDSTDMSVDILRNVTLPLLQNFGVWGATLEVKRRGAVPKGGGVVHFTLPPVKKDLKPLHVTDEGLVKRVRGVAFSAKISPGITSRVVDSCRAVLNKVLPDVHIEVDHWKGERAGHSPGYSLSLVAETTSGVLLSVERTAASRHQQQQQQHIQQQQQHHMQLQGAGAGTAWTGGAGASGGGGGADAPEDVGRDAAMMLLQEIYKGGVIDSMHQPLVLQLMVLTPEDVSKVRFGVLSGQAVQVLRLLREAFGVTFKIRQEISTALPALKTASATASDGKRQRREEESGEESDEDDDDDEKESSGDEEEEEEEGSEEEGSEEDSDGEVSEEGSREEEDVDGENESDSDEENTGSSSAKKRNASAVAAAPLQRTTVVLSCYGVGYSNVYRKVT
mmetsp:Transcript_68133/g.133966  ORF Transcript_68133/g.133966 Transcript_68133/m.133966 type:complete len:517 (+) Transcript_68133:47-1597(+)